MESFDYPKEHEISPATESRVSNQPTENEAFVSKSIIRATPRSERLPNPSLMMGNSKILAADRLTRRGLSTTSFDALQIPQICWRQLQFKKALLSVGSF